MRRGRGFSVFNLGLGFVLLRAFSEPDEWSFLRFESDRKLFTFSERYLSLLDATGVPLVVEDEAIAEIEHELKLALVDDGSAVEVQMSFGDASEGCNNSFGYFWQFRNFRCNFAMLRYQMSFWNETFHLVSYSTLSLILPLLALCASWASWWGQGPLVHYRVVVGWWFVKEPLKQLIVNFGNDTIPSCRNRSSRFPKTLALAPWNGEWRISSWQHLSQVMTAQTSEWNQGESLERKRRLSTLIHSKAGRLIWWPSFWNLPFSQYLNSSGPDHLKGGELSETRSRYWPSFGPKLVPPFRSWNFPKLDLLPELPPMCHKGPDLKSLSLILAPSVSPDHPGLYCLKARLGQVFFESLFFLLLLPSSFSFLVATNNTIWFVMYVPTWETLVLFVYSMWMYEGLSRFHLSWMSCSSSLPASSFKLLSIVLLCAWIIYFRLDDLCQRKKNSGIQERGLKKLHQCLSITLFSPTFHDPPCQGCLNLDSKTPSHALMLCLSLFSSDERSETVFVIVSVDHQVSRFKATAWTREETRSKCTESSIVKKSFWVSRWVVGEIETKE